MVLRAAGTNCDGETVHALRAAGAEVERVHLNRVLREPDLLDRFQLLVLAGGFTFGDDVASGAVFSFILKERLYDRLVAFIESGRAVLGVCNGFQILVRLGFLPGRGAKNPKGRASLLPNLSGRFEDRWVHLRAGSQESRWLEAGAEYLMPVAHAEGRFEWFPDVAGTAFPDDQIALRYIDRGDHSAQYPANPNGSHRGIAGITNSEGNVLGLMPHPERFCVPWHHPHWTRLRAGSGPPPDALGVPLGLDVYRRVVNSFR